VERYPDYAGREVSLRPATPSCITQNVDGLHPLVGTTNLLELHGNIWKVRCANDGTVSYNRDVPLREIPPRCSDCGALLRYVNLSSKWL
jgi:NAD-dependent SIR2 family protein deacetylase